MLVIRYTNIIKPGHMDELVAAHTAFVEAVDFPCAVRTYVSMFGPLDVLNVEYEFESIAEYESSQAEWSNVPELDAFFEKLGEARKAGGNREVWHLVA